MKSQLWTYSNTLSATGLANDEVLDRLTKSYERIRVQLEKCDFNADLMLFIDAAATGSIVDDPVGYIQCHEHRELVRDGVGGIGGLTTAMGELVVDGSESSDYSKLSDLHSVPPQFAIARDREHKEHEESFEQTFNYDQYDVPPKSSVLFKGRVWVYVVRVVYDYLGQAPEELDIRKDQIVPVVATHEDGWWEGFFFVYR